jgi:hypothetical protein
MGSWMGLLTRGAKDKYFPGVLQAIVVAVQNRCCGCEEPGQVFEDLRWRCHDDKTRNPPGPSPGVAVQLNLRLVVTQRYSVSLTLLSTHTVVDHDSRGSYFCLAPPSYPISCLRAISWRAWLQGTFTQVLRN